MLIYYNCGLAYLKLDLDDDAEKYFLQTLKINSRLSQSLFLLGMIQQRRGDVEGAEHYFGLAHRMNPGVGDSVGRMQPP